MRCAAGRRDTLGNSELALLRAELESTRAVAARLAELRRARNDRADLVPVRKTDVVVWRSPTES